MIKLLTLSFTLFAFSSFSQSVVKIPAAGLAVIQESDLKKDLYEHADASFKGRAAGTINELNGAAWIAEKYRSIGLKPIMKQAKMVKN